MSDFEKKDLLAAYLESYKSARSEIIERIKQRDTLYSYYLIAVGGLAGIRAIAFAIESAEYNTNTLVAYFDIPLAPLTIYPFLAVFFCMIISQHQVQIGKLGYLCGVTLSRQKFASIIHEQFTNWETELSRYKLNTLPYFTVAHALLFIVPSALACIAQTALLYFSYTPKWHGLLPAENSVKELQQYVSIISVTALNIISWYFLILTMQTLENSGKDRKRLEDARSDIMNDNNANIGDIEKQLFVKAGPRMWSFYINYTLGLIFLMTIFTQFVLFIEKDRFKIVQTQISGSGQSSKAHVQD